jgi:hypothetical protein
MIAIDKFGYEKVIEIAKKMGFNEKKPAELQKYIDEISTMDLWDISRLLFFGHQYVKNDTNN